MTTKMMHVKGSIFPKNPENVLGNTGYRITTEMIRNRLVGTLLNPNESMAKWDKGMIECDTRTETNGGGRPAAMDFITRLYNVVTSPGIKELGLQGELMITVEGVKEPVILRATIENGNVFYNEAKLLWEDEPVAFM
jgi:hypothetical protein